jgi:hypothetical protein
MEFTPQQEIKRKLDRSGADISAAEAGQGPAPMSNWPLLQFIENLEGFDFVALLLGSVVVFFSVGFAIDYIVGRYGMGPYWSAFYAMLGAYAGLCIRDWWLQPYAAYDPYVTTIAVSAGLLATVVMVSAVAKR